MAPKRKAPQVEPTRREKLTMELTPSQVKLLLGENGALIRQLRAETTASLKVFDEPGSSPYVVIKGTIETVYAAKDKIAAAIATDQVHPMEGLDDPERTPQPSTAKSREALLKWLASQSEMGKEKLRDTIAPISAAKPKELLGSLRCRLSTGKTSDLKVLVPQAPGKSTAIIGKVAPVASAIGGMSTGAVVGAVVGLPAALVTFGLSIPVCAATGGAVGGATGFYAGRKVEEALLGSKPSTEKPIVRTLSQLWEREEQERREERARRGGSPAMEKSSDTPIPRTLSQLWELEIARREQRVAVEETRVAKTWLELTAQTWLGGAGASWVGAAIPAKRTFIHYAERSGLIKTSASAPIFPRNASDLSREASSPKLAPADLASRA
jgi:hypothetical protein